MKKFYIILVLFILQAQCIVFSEDKVNQAEIDRIIVEGFLMYNLERASWISTDILTSKYDINKIKLNGYFSYNLGRDFYSIYYKLYDTIPMAFNTYIFKDTVLTKTIVLDTTIRPLTEYETLIYNIKNHVNNSVLSMDTMFKLPKGSVFNTVFIRDEEIMKVFFLTSTDKKYLIPFGNDYLITYDMKGNLLNKSKLHLSYIPIDYSKEGDTTLIILHNHTEFSSEYITSTDICNFMLHGPKKSKSGCYVISEKWLCMFNNKPNMMVIRKEVLFK